MNLDITEELAEIGKRLSVMSNLLGKAEVMSSQELFMVADAFRMTAFKLTNYAESLKAQGK